MAERQDLSRNANSRENVAKQTSPPIEGTSRTFEFSDIRKCHGQLSNIVRQFDEQPSGTIQTKKRKSDEVTERALQHQLSEIQTDVRRQSEGQDRLREGQEELRENVQDLMNSFKSKSVNDLDSEPPGHLSHSLSLCRMCSRTTSFSSNGMMSPFGTNSETGDTLSAKSFFSHNFEITQKLEACLSREMLKSIETGVKRIEIKTQEVSGDLKNLQNRVQELWKTLSASDNNIRPVGSLPPHIHAFCLRIQDVIHIRVYDLARNLEVIEKFVIRGNYRNVFWRVIDQWNVDCRNKGTVPLLETLIEACIKSEIPNPLEVEPMPLADRQVLERNYSYLAENLMVPLLLTYLRDTGMLTPNLVKYVLEPEPRPEKVTRLVDIITVFGKHGLHLLKHALKRSGQGHIADGLEYPEEALDPSVPVSALPSARVRLYQSLKCQLEEICVSTNKVRRQDRVCNLQSGTIWSGFFLNMEVSIKIPAADVESLLTLMEANQLRGLKHKHIVKLVGVSMQPDSTWLITEPVSCNLITRVRRLQDADVSFSVILDMAVQVCKGMVYMEEQKCYHGDLRAENVLVFDDGILKIANFRIRPPDMQSNPVHDDQVNSSLRWSSPELMLNGEVNTKTDVWAYGVLFWELVTFGLVPYHDMSIDDVKRRVTNGFTLPRPHTSFTLPDTVYDIMMDCWKFHPSRRPSFQKILSQFAGTRKRSPRRMENSDASHRRHPAAGVRRSFRERPKSLPVERERRELVKAASGKDKDESSTLSSEKKRRSFFSMLGFRKKKKTSEIKSCFYARLNSDG